MGLALLKHSIGRELAQGELDGFSAMGKGRGVGFAEPTSGLRHHGTQLYIKELH